MPTGVVAGEIGITRNKLRRAVRAGELEGRGGGDSWRSLDEVQVPKRGGEAMSKVSRPRPVLEQWCSSFLRYEGTNSDERVDRMNDSWPAPRSC